MNWELSSAIKRKCPCGQGTYTVRTFLDDWKRREEQWDMDCLKCRQKYDLCSSTNPKSGRLLRSNRWVRRHTLSFGDYSIAAKKVDSGGEELREQRNAVKANVFESQISKTRVLKGGFR